MEIDQVFARLVSRLKLLFRRYTSHEITGTQLQVLRLLRSNGACNTTFLADYLGVTLSAITSLVNRLHKMGFVEREKKEKDRRQVWINLSAVGHQMLRDIEEKRYELLSHFFLKMPEEERQELLKIVTRAVELMEREDILNDSEI